MKMTIKEQHKELCEWLGYQRKDTNSTYRDISLPWIHPDGHDIPQLPPLSLDLMHEAEMKLGPSLPNEESRPAIKYWIELGHVTAMPNPRGGEFVSEVNKVRATKEQRLEALLRTVGRWRE